MRRGGRPGVAPRAGEALVVPAASVEGRGSRTNRRRGFSRGTKMEPLGVALLRPSPADEAERGRGRHEGFGERDFGTQCSKHQVTVTSTLPFKQAAVALPCPPSWHHLAGRHPPPPPHTHTHAPCAALPGVPAACAAAARKSAGDLDMRVALMLRRGRMRTPERGVMERGVMREAGRGGPPASRPAGRCVRPTLYSGAGETWEKVVVGLVKLGVEDEG